MEFREAAESTYRMLGFIMLYSSRRESVPTSPIIVTNSPIYVNGLRAAECVRYNPSLFKFSSIFFSLNMVSKLG
jgi:hypothetical protein